MITSHRINQYTLLIFYTLVTLIVSCDTSNTIAGTNNETQTKGTFFRPDGKPATGARIQAFALESSIADSTPVALGIVDEWGAAMISLPRGKYSFVVRDSTGLIAWSDTVTSLGDSLRIRRDTLRAPGRIVGAVSVPAGRKSENATIFLPRTGLWTHPDSLGQFQISGVPEISLPLEAVCGESDCIPVFRSLIVKPGITTNVGTIELLNSSLGIANGLHGSYNDTTGIVHLEWQHPKDSSATGFVVFRTPLDTPRPSYEMEHYFIDSSSFSQEIFTSISFWHDRDLSQKIEAYTYFVGLRRQGGEISSTFASIRIAVKPPIAKQQWKIAPPVDSVIIPDTTFHDAFSSTYQIDSMGNTIVVTGMSPLNWKVEARRCVSVFLAPGETSRVASYYIEPEQEGPPVIWKGRIWTVAGMDPQPEPPSDPRFELNRQLDFPWFEKASIRSSTDGVAWDTVILPGLPPKATNFHFEVKSNRIFLQVRYQESGILGFVETISEPIATFSSLDGRTWTRDDGGTFERTELIDYNAGILQRTVYGSSRRFIPTSDTSDITIFQHLGGDREVAIATGFVPDTSFAHFTFKNQGSWDAGIPARGNGTFLAIIHDSKLGLALTTTPKIVQQIEIPGIENIAFATGFWRGYLIAASGRTLYLFRLPELKALQ